MILNNSEVCCYTLYTVGAFDSIMANITESAEMTISKCHHQSTEIIGLIIKINKKLNNYTSRYSLMIQ